MKHVIEVHFNSQVLAVVALPYSANPLPTREISDDASAPTTEGRRSSVRTFKP